MEIGASVYHIVNRFGCCCQAWGFAGCAIRMALAAGMDAGGGAGHFVDKGEVPVAGRCKVGPSRLTLSTLVLFVQANGRVCEAV